MTLEEVIRNKKFIKTDNPETKVLLVKGGTKDGIEIGLSDYCVKEYAKLVREHIREKLPKRKRMAIGYLVSKEFIEGYNQAIEEMERSLGV